MTKYWVMGAEKKILTPISIEALMAGGGKS